MVRMTSVSGRVVAPHRLAGAIIFYRVAWEGGHADFKWYEDAEREAMLRSRETGTACMVEYHHDGVMHALMNRVQFRDGDYAKPVRRVRLTSAV